MRKLWEAELEKLKITRTHKAIYRKPRTPVVSTSHCEPKDKFSRGFIMHEFESVFLRIIHKHTIVCLMSGLHIMCFCKNIYTFLPDKNQFRCDAMRCDARRGEARRSNARQEMLRNSTSKQPWNAVWLS